MKVRGPSLSVARRLSPCSLEHRTLHEHPTPARLVLFPMCRRFPAHASADRGMSSGGGCLPPRLPLLQWGRPERAVRRGQSRTQQSGDRERWDQVGSLADPRRQCPLPVFTWVVGSPFASSLQQPAARVASRRVAYEAWRCNRGRHRASRMACWFCTVQYVQYKNSAHPFM